MNIVLGIIQNTVSTNQIILELRTFAERCEDNSNLIGLHFWEIVPKRLVADELKYTDKLKSRFFEVTTELAIIESTIFI